MNEPEDFERETAGLLGQLKVAPSPAARERAFARVAAEFATLQASTRNSTTAAPRRRAPRWALAAGVATLAVAGAWFMNRPGPVVARVESIDGVIDAQAPGWLSRPSTLTADAGITAGTTLVVADRAGALLRISADLTVRLGAGSRARLVASDTIGLDEGQAFVDAVPGAHAPLRIVTPQGAVTHLGTQYLVTAAPDRVEVAVREGRAQLTTAGASAVAEAGQWLLRRAGDAAPQSGSLVAGDARFDWIAALPTDFKLDGATIDQFLAWFHRETGLNPVYKAGVDTEHLRAVRLRGSIDNLEPFEALKFVLETADLTWHREGASVVIEQRASAGT